MEITCAKCREEVSADSDEGYFYADSESGPLKYTCSACDCREQGEAYALFDDPERISADDVQGDE